MDLQLPVAGGDLPGLGLKRKRPGSTYAQVDRRRCAFGDWGADRSGRYLSPEHGGIKPRRRGGARVGGRCNSAEQGWDGQLHLGAGQRQWGQDRTGPLQTAGLHGGRAEGYRGVRDGPWHEKPARFDHQGEAGGRQEAHHLGFEAEWRKPEVYFAGKLVLPRPKDAVEMIRDVYGRRQPHAAEGNFARELVIDISDAYMSLGLDPKELPHALAPNVENGDFYLFSAMLFGFKTAPLVWSRVAALVARLLQSLLQGDEGMHQVYLDDSLWVLQRSLKQRNSNLAERASHVQWVGVKFFLQDYLIILSLPERFTKDLLSLLRGWDGGKAVVAIRDFAKGAMVGFTILPGLTRQIGRHRLCRRSQAPPQSKGRSETQGWTLCSQTTWAGPTVAYDVLGRGHGETTASFQVGRGAVSQRDGSHLVDKQQTGQGTGVQGDEGGRRTTQLWGQLAIIGVTRDCGDVGGVAGVEGLDNAAS